MIGMNIRILRKRNRLSQEALAEHLKVSRQTITKWENNESVPDINECQILAGIFHVTLDQLAGDCQEEDMDALAPAGKHIFGVVKVGERGQVVIPKRVRDRYGIKAGDQMAVLGDDESRGIAFVKTEHFFELAKLFASARTEEEDE